MSKNKDLNKISQELFKSYPDKVRVYVTTDGQGFFNKNYAINHAAKNKLEYQEFFRDGFEKEDTTDLEELLVSTEEKVLAQEAVLEAIQDAANVEAEETPSIPEDAHEALKAVGELRTAFHAKDELLVTAAEATSGYNALVANLTALVKGNDTKLAQEIVKILPVNTEE